jgi:tyrosine-specific transport protein
MMMNKMRILGGAFLMSGVAIGAGMLAIPPVTGALGFPLAILVFVLVFAFTILSALYVLEANLALEPGTNFISMAKEFLGRYGQALSWFFYLFFLYAVTAAYTVGGGYILQDVVERLFHLQLSSEISMVLFLVLFGAFVYFGTRPTDYINRILMVGLILSYLGLIVFVTPYAHTDLLLRGEIKYVWYSIPVIVLAFCAHLIVPTLRIYHEGRIKELVLVLFLGTLVPFIFYAVWELTILGIVPIEGAQGLAAINHSGDVVGTLISALSEKTGATALGDLVGAFSFFALVTSFLGCSLSLMHFLKDGFSLPNTRAFHWLNILLTFIPGFLFAVLSPKGFILALSYAGVIVAILFGLMPVLMVWKLRYGQTALRSTFTVPGGKPVLFITGACAILVLIVQILSQLKCIPLP